MSHDRRDDRHRTPVVLVPAEQSQSRRREDVDDVGREQRRQILSPDEIAEACQARCMREGGPMYKMTATVDEIVQTVSGWRGGLKVAVLVLSIVGILFTASITLAVAFGPGMFRNAVSAEFDARMGILLDRAPKKAENWRPIPSAQAAPVDWTVAAKPEKGTP
jgi:hypothetical protein